MDNHQKYAVLSLELHLFFARIMKEHSLFLRAAFTPAGATYAEKAAFYQQEFEKILSRAVRLGNGIVGWKVVNSGEVVTEFTAQAEKQTQKFTGIHIDEAITALETRLSGSENPSVSPELYREVKQLNQTAIKQLQGLIALKEKILYEVLHCRMFTMNYPLLIEHILREADLYYTYLMQIENEMDWDYQNMKETEQFWNQIMMEHALFIRGLLDPSEYELVQTSEEFAKDYARLLADCREKQDVAMDGCRGASLAETLKFRDFKTAGVKGIEGCEIRSIILPLLADHVLREANHYIRLLKE